MNNFETILGNSTNRFDLWVNFLTANQCKNIAELGVYKGAFAETILQRCPLIENYIMIDPWRNLEEWNKPANVSNKIFDDFYEETLSKTEFAKHKRKILRGKTIEVINNIEDESLDFVYIDGDHTLRGITIDLINMWSKVSKKGFIGGDDFTTTMWQHNKNFEPTLVFPFAVYFAEAVNAKIYAFPYNQFLITKESNGFEFIDLTKGKYKNLTLLHQFNHPKKKPSIKSILKKYFPALRKLKKSS